MPWSSAVVSLLMRYSRASWLMNGGGDVEAGDEADVLEAQLAGLGDVAADAHAVAGLDGLEDQPVPLVQRQVEVILAVPPVVRHREFLEGVKGIIAGRHHVHVVVHVQRGLVLQEFLRRHLPAVVDERLRRRAQGLFRITVTWFKNVPFVPEVVAFDEVQVTALISSIRGFVVQFFAAGLQPG